MVATQFMLTPTNMEGQLNDAHSALRFILAGNATFTIRSKQTGTRFTYKIREAEEQPGKPAVWFVNLLNGPDNEGDFCYMGILKMQRARSLEDLLNADITFNFTRKSSVKPEALSAKSFVWLWNVLYGQQRMPSTVEIWHEGRCGRCGRKLTVPESIDTGFGPECASRLGL